MLQSPGMLSRRVISLGNFFSAAHFFLIIFIITPYLATLVPERETGYVISLGALVSLAAFPLLPRLVRAIGQRHLAIGLALFEIILLTWLAFTEDPLSAILLVALGSAAAPFISYQLDLLLEASITAEDATGRVRTAFLTMANIALIAAPLAVGYLLGESDDYARVFLAAAASLVPFIVLLLAYRLPEGTPPSLTNIRTTIRCVFNNRDLASVTFAHFVLQCFYHLAPVFIPLYLHTALGIPWSELGWIFAVMLLPFILFEYPAGWLADRKFGDKEIMVIGFLIMGVAFAAVAVIDAATPIYITVAILVATRVGAALADSMTEGHFFRRVSERDANTISVFRMLRPLAALSAPALGSVLLVSSGYGTLFVVTGLAVAVLGAVAARRIIDIR